MQFLCLPTLTRSTTFLVVANSQRTGVLMLFWLFYTLLEQKTISKVKRNDQQGNLEVVPLLLGFEKSASQSDTQGGSSHPA